MKILCNRCYQPLIVHEYDIGLFVDICDRCVDDINMELSNEDRDELYNEGYSDGYDDGNSII